MAQKLAFSGWLHPISDLGENIGLWDEFQRSALDVPKTPKDKAGTSIATSINTCPKTTSKTTTPQTSFRPMFTGILRVVGVTGFEPVTSCM